MVPSPIHYQAPQFKNFKSAANCRVKNLVKAIDELPELLIDFSDERQFVV